MKIARVFLVAAFLAATASSANAQIGISAGVNFASVNATVDGADVSTGDRTGFNGGVFVGKGGLIGFMGGLFYSQKGFSVSDESINLDYLEVPLMLRVKFLMLRGYAGPNLAFELSCKGEPVLDGASLSCDNTESFDFGWKIGVGGTLLFFNLDVAYVWGTTDIWKAENGSVKNQVIQVNLGLGI
jgi:hypothetical protein